MSQILVDTVEAVRVVRFARPEKKNAITEAMYAALHEALVAAREDSAVRAVLLGGAPGVFTAGNDLADFLQHPPTGEDSAVFRFLRALVEFPKPVVVAVDGAAIGIGTTLLLHCDLVVATPRAKFALPFAKLALVPEAGSSFLLPLVAGYHRAAEWLLLGEPFSGEEAYRAGLVNRLVEPEALEQTAMAMASALAALPPEAVQLSKRLLRDPLHDTTIATIRREAAVFVQRLQSAEARQAFQAFLSRG
ncbi:MAG: enoyl-CoA hydratase [Vicinamibacterales bacterium]|jgi:enoyl-CoA hydratase/carnithine racemase|nr:enoyl-CoA hydratase [Vicinamibacterales bacterium]